MQPRPHPRAWTQRLRQMYRSAGWPLLDGLELELVAAAMLERLRDPANGHELLRLTDAGIACAVQGMASNRAAMSAHEQLVHAVALAQHHAGRLAWTNLSLRVDVQAANRHIQPDATPGKAKWVVAQPDVFSLRNTSVERYLSPLVHEIKVSRADALGELRKPLKTAAYLQMASEVWMVLGTHKKGTPIAKPEEIPASMGVMQAWPIGDSQEPRFRFEVLRSAPHRPHSPAFAHWMALAKTQPLWFAQELQAQLVSSA